MGSVIFQLGTMILLILMNSFFAGSEIAFISLNMGKIRILAEDGDNRAKKVVKIMEDPSNFLSAISIGVSLSSVFSGALASDAFSDNLARFIMTITNDSFSIATIRPLSVFLVTFITMYLLLVFGELVPKRIAMAHAEKFALTASHLVGFLAKLFTPLVHALSFSTNIFLKMFGIDPNQVEEISEEEIRIMVEQGEIDISEKEMIRNVFEFDNLEVGDIMTHRTDVVAIDVNTSFDEVMKFVESERYTRYPIYEDSIDNIVGIVHLRDLLSFIQSGENKEKFKFKNILREPYFVPESKRTDELFKELTTNKTHIAVVIDEYGGTAGIVTLEDLIEEVMGNIMDEYDDEEETITIVHEDEYLVEGYADIEDLEDIINVDLPIEDYDTVSGFVIGEIGRIPTVEDVNSDASDFIYNGYLFSIVDIDEKVISKIRVLKIEEELEDEED